MKKRKIKVLCASLAALIICAVPFIDGTRAGAAGEIEIFCETETDPEIIRLGAAADAADPIPCAKTQNRDLSEKRLCPGGMPFGVKMSTDGILIVDVGYVDARSGAVNPGEKAGLRSGDIIVRINGEYAAEAEQLREAARAGEGKPIAVTVRREGSEFETNITPAYSESESLYKLGIMVKSRAAGIGTVTFIDPETGEFGGLGHGICDADTGAILPLADGDLYDVRIDGVQKGSAGFPGELHGYFNSGKTGSLFSNTPCGVFGVRSSPPENAGDTMALCPASELHTGLAFILCTVDGSEPREYTVNIREIVNSGDCVRNFVVDVTDPDLIAATGGIVQGMSGSPVIQDGRLAGALTHVLINDPTCGYGIFIENMLSAMG